MIKNYVKIAWRNLLKNRTFSLINIIGLAVSMSVCLLIISVIADQKSYDTFHEKIDRIYRVLTAGKNSNQMKSMASSALPLGEELRNNYSGVESAASIARNIGGDLFYKDKIASGGGYFADGNLLRILDFKLKEGNAETALENPRSLIVSEEIAEQLFLHEDPIGKTVRLNDTDLSPTGVDNGNRETELGEFTITGVMEPLPGKTHLPFKILVSLNSMKALAADSLLDYEPQNWNNIWSNYTYVLMQEGKKQADLQQVLDQVSEKYYPDGEENQFAFRAQALTEVTPGDIQGNETHVPIPKIFLTILSILCLVVMVSACLNYTNLSVARSLTRAREVGVRKVSGATRKQIFGQFITEAVIISLVSLVCSVLILFVLQSLFSNLVINRYIKVSFTHGPGLYLVFTGFSVAVGILAGILPAIYISAFNPVEILKNFTGFKVFRRLTIRKALLVVQFTISLIFIISTTLIYRQTDHIFHFDYGFNQDNVVNVTLFKQENYQRFVSEISFNKDVLVAGACSYLPASGTQNGTRVIRTDSKDSLQITHVDVDANSLDVWDLDLIAGENFPEIASRSGESYVLINEEAVSKFKFGSPRQAIGQNLLVDGHNVEVRGVVKDFQFLDVTRGIEPLMLRNRFSEFSYLTIRISGENPPATLDYLKETWQKVNPATKFEYEFYDQQLQLIHTMFSNAAGVLGFIAFLAVFISLLGLLGMAAYTAQSRRKEIGVRKILGSGARQVVFLLSKSYLILLGIAIIIATPAAYFINNLWLNFFVSRVSIDAFVLIFSILSLLVVSFLVILSQAWQAAVTNPVKSLRSE